MKLGEESWTGGRRSGLPSREIHKLEEVMARLKALHKRP